MCRRIGEHGATLIADGARVLTHCNTGALATGGIGTALAAVYVAVESGKRVEVYADETRPLLQGSRLTAWELQRAGIPVTVLVDGAAASLLRDGDVDLCIVGADRIATNGDVANKVGTYPLAIAACRHSVPFYVAAPTSTFDPATPRGDEILIEQRSADEVAARARSADGAGERARLQSRVRRHAGGAHLGDRERPRDPPAAVRFLGARGVKHVLAVDAGTTGVTCLVIGADGQGRRARLSRGPAVFPGGGSRRARRERDPRVREGGGARRRRRRLGSA